MIHLNNDVIEKVYLKTFHKELPAKDFVNTVSFVNEIINECLTNYIHSGCTLAKTGRGDCENFVGLPGESIPNQHDGDNDTVDVYGKPNGWCWSCWKSYRIKELEAELNNKQANNKLVEYLSATDLLLNEIYRIQMAGISSASHGHWKLGDSIHPDYLTTTIKDVAELYEKYDQLFKLCISHGVKIPWLVSLLETKPLDKSVNALAIKNPIHNTTSIKEDLIYNVISNDSDLPLKITKEYIDNICGKEEDADYTLFSGTLHTVCCIKLPNGATVIGESVCASKEIFDARKGRTYAFENAKEKVWELEGYSLCEKRYQAGLAK